METNNKYFKGYWFICEKAKNRVLPKHIYIERHHIYPKSIYGENKELVKLTAAEHFQAHYMLWQGFRLQYGSSDSRTRKMASAFSRMRCINKNGIKYKISSKQYELLKNANSEARKNIKMSDETKLKISLNAKNNPNFGNKNRIFSIESRLKMSNSRKGLKQSDETIKKRVEKNFGQKRSDEIKEKMKLAQQNLSDTSKKNKSEKIRNSKIGRKHSDETKLKMSLSRKKYLNNTN